MNNYKEKYGEWALITGASSGIGEEFARRLAQQGMNIILVARRRNLLSKLALEIKQNFKVKTLIVCLDLTKDESYLKLFDKVGDREIGLLINNAGFGSIGQFDKIDTEHEMSMVKLNCVAPTVITHYFVEPMIERKKGAIIFLGSVAGFYPVPFMTTYAATKVFNSYLGIALWFELKKHNIDVLSLNPGGTTTGFQRIAKTTTGPFVRTPHEVVTTALKSLGKRHSVIDGFPNKIMVGFSKIVPSKLLVTITGNLSQRLYKQK